MLLDAKMSLKNKIPQTQVKCFMCDHYSRRYQEM
jgi:hypothetical protein